MTRRVLMGAALLAVIAAAPHHAAGAPDVPPAADAPDAGVKDAGEPRATSYDLISDGKRIDVKDKDFSIQPPTGWEVFTTHPNLTLLMQVPYQKSQKYQRTIQVASFTGPRYMDDTTAKEFEELIVRKFSQLSTSIEGYRIRNHTPIALTDGRQGLLFYSEFKINGVDLMQAHILVSSPTRHYLMTYTDVAEHFEKDEQNQFLSEAWDAMTSVKLKGRTPARFESFIAIGAGLGVLLLFGIVFWVMRSWRSGRKFKEYESGRGLEDVELQSKEPKSLVGGDDSDGDDQGTAQGLDDEDEDVGRARAKAHQAASPPAARRPPPQTPLAAVPGQPRRPAMPPPGPRVTKPSPPSAKPAGRTLPPTRPGSAAPSTIGAPSQQTNNGDDDAEPFEVDEDLAV